MIRKSHLGPATRSVLLPSVAVVEGVDQHGVPVAETITVRPIPWWNNVRRAWMVDGPDGQPVLADPQPPPPVFGTSISFPDVPPAVKVMT